LERGSSGKGVSGAGEDRKQAVSRAPALQKGAAVGIDGGLSECIMPGERLAHRLGVLLPQAGAALDVGEDKGNRSRREIAHSVHLRQGSTAAAVAEVILIT